MLFPAIVFNTNLSWMQKDIKKNEGSWFQLFMLFNFNMGNTIASTVAGFSCCSAFGRKPTLIGTYSRILFFSTYFLILFQVGPFTSDWFKILNTFIFGFT